jgi:hypothetical protein
MADVAFSDLTALTSLQRADLICATDDSESGAEKSKKVTMGTLQDFLMPTGFHIRPQFTFSSGTSLLIGPGASDVDGKYAYWVSQLTETLSGLSANTQYYVYLDYSAITSGTAVTATEIIVSSTAPSYSNTKVGWYNGSDKCIFGFLTEAASTNMREFFHDGDVLLYADYIEERAKAALTAQTWTDVDMASAIPGFCTGALVTFRGNGVSTTGTNILWRTNGQTASTGHFIFELDKQNSVNLRPATQAMVVTDPSQIIEIYSSVAAVDTHQVGVYVDGWYFPVGM